MQKYNELYDKVEALQNLLVSFSTGGTAEDDDYIKLRQELIAEPLVKEHLPRYIYANRNLAQFWQFIKYEKKSYQERREYLWAAFRPILSLLENYVKSPADDAVSKTMGEFNVEFAYHEWQKALQRRFDDPEGAITSARTLIETICKHILDELKVEYEEGADLPSLYRKAVEQLSLSPGQHTEKIFKQILGGCQAVVEGLGAIRNKHSDAHGKGKQQIKPVARHAELAVNLAGAMGTFLISTYKARKEVEVEVEVQN